MSREVEKASMEVVTVTTEDSSNRVDLYDPCSPPNYGGRPCYKKAVVSDESAPLFTINVGDSVLLQGPSSDPFIAQIVSIFVSKPSNIPGVRVCWYYRASEVVGLAKKLDKVSSG
jgi:hypothetical protein